MKAGVGAGISLDPDWRPVAATLAVLISLLLAGSLAMPIAEHGFGVPAGDPPLVLGWTDPLLAMNSEANVPTWFSSVLLAACALTTAICALDAYRRGLHHRWHWAALVLIFLYLSLDETAVLHERFGRITRLVADPGILYGWIYAGAALAAGVGLAFLGFLRALPAPTGWLFALSGALYLGGALGFEIVASLLQAGRAEAYDGSLAQVIATHVEEVLEMAGASVFLCASLRHIRSEIGSIRIAHDRGGPA